MPDVGPHDGSRFWLGNLLNWKDDTVVLEPSGLYYPNRFARLMMQAMQDVMGLHGLNTILSLAGLDNYIDQMPPDNLAKQFDFAYIAAIAEALEDVYGPRGGRGIALRIGRAMVTNGLNNFGALAGMASNEYRRLPVDKRLYIGLETLAAVFTRFSDQESSVQDMDTVYHFLAEPSPMAWGRPLDQPVSHMLVGIIQATLHWSTQHEYHVQELPPSENQSDESVFRVNKQPIGGVSFG